MYCTVLCLSIAAIPAPRTSDGSSGMTGQRVRQLESQQAQIDALRRSVENEVRVQTEELSALRQRRQLLASGVDRLERQADEADERAYYLERNLAPLFRALHRLAGRDRLSAAMNTDAAGEQRASRRVVHHFLSSGLRQLRTLQAIRSMSRLSIHRAALLREHALSATEVVQARRRELMTVQLSLERLGQVASAALTSLREQLEDNEADDPAANALPNADSLRLRKGTLHWPVRGIVTIPFGRMVNPLFHTVTFHGGIDFQPTPGAAVQAVANGEVLFVGTVRGYGTVLIVEHPGMFHTVYGRVHDAAVEVGDVVNSGDVLAHTEATEAAPVYFELRRRGRAIDPLPWLLPEPTSAPADPVDQERSP